MGNITRQNTLELLNGDWAGYVARFQILSPDAQTAFLKKQGYKRLADLLAHIAAWWAVGMQNIQNYRDNPEAKMPEIDVDSFNARAVKEVRAVSEAEEMHLFEEARKKFTAFVEQLSEEDFQDERVLNQIKWELVNHLEDHRIS
jgi:hypothetical protein